jgi:Uma2 family endonuclease
MFFNRQPPATEKKVILPKVSWEKLEALLTELGVQRSVQITYDRGQLEMLEPHPQRDRVQRLIESLLLLIADEVGDDLVNCGSMLLKQAALGVAIQPDACYYQRSRSPRRGRAIADRDIAGRDVGDRDAGDRAELDLMAQSAPQLVVDVQWVADVSIAAALKRLEIFAALGIAEVWQYRIQIDQPVDQENVKGELRLYDLRLDQTGLDQAAPDRAGRQPCPMSRLYPFLSTRQIVEFIDQSNTIGLTQALTLLRAWTRTVIE